jgi:hypothetical protein
MDGKKKSDGGNGKKSPSVVERLLALAEGEAREVFRDELDVPYVAAPEGGAHRVIPLDSEEAKSWLTRLYYLDTKKEGKPRAPNAEAVKATINALRARASFDGQRREVFRRFAEVDGALWIDLGDDSRRAIRITEAGWGIVDRHGVYFVRAKGLRALPLPARGGKLDELRRFISCDHDGWILLVTWILSTCRAPQQPFGALVLLGPEGAGKSMAARLIREAIDPRTGGLRPPPRDETELAIGALHQHVCAYDNVSRISDDLSDALCRLTTGIGISRRRLFTEYDEAVIELYRPVIMNGIGAIVSRPDLVSRSLPLHLNPVPDEERLTELHLMEQFRSAHPKILGAICDALVACVQGHEASTKESGALPRLADVVTWARCAEAELGLAPGSVVETLRARERNALLDILSTDPVASAVLELVRPGAAWQGTPTELYRVLTRLAGDPLPRAWPRAANALSRRLRRLARALGKLGVEIDVCVAREDGERITVLERHKFES